MSEILKNIFLAIRSDQDTPDWEVSQKLFLKNAEIAEEDLEEINKALEKGDKESLFNLIQCAMEGISNVLDLIAEDKGESYYLSIYSEDLKAKKIGRIYKSEIAKRHAIGYSIANDNYNDYALYLKGRGYIKPIIELMVEHEDEKDSPEWTKFCENAVESYDAFIAGIIDSFTIPPRESFHFSDLLLDPKTHEKLNGCSNCVPSIRLYENLYYAIMNKKKEEVIKIIKDADPSINPRSSNLCLSYAFMEDPESKMDILDLVLERDITGYFKESMIKLFSNRDDKVSQEIVMLVLDCVDKEDVGRVAGLGIGFPAANGYLDMVKLLLERGADPHIGLANSKRRNRNQIVEFIEKFMASS